MQAYIFLTKIKYSFVLQPYIHARTIQKTTFLCTEGRRLEFAATASRTDYYLFDAINILSFTNNMQGYDGLASVPFSSMLWQNISQIGLLPDSLLKSNGVYSEMNTITTPTQFLQLFKAIIYKDIHGNYCLDDKISLIALLLWKLDTNKKTKLLEQFEL